jgi:C-terminal processing protease CtpA/Prc
MADLGTVELMADFALGRPELGTPEMITITEQALALLSQLYVHLPSKRALHATDPIQSLRNLRTDLDAVERGAFAIREREFHGRILRTFVGLRDRHTVYVLPQPYRSTIAFLPFLVEAVDDNRTRAYIVSKVFSSFEDKLPVGARVTHWNGVPIELAVEQNGERNAGANRAARLARGLDRLTFRWLGTTLEPDEDWVVVGFEDEAGKRHQDHFDWLAVLRVKGTSAPSRVRGNAFALGRDLEGEWIRKVKAKLFARQDKWETSKPGGNVAYRPHPPGRVRRKYGYLRIYSFDVDPNREDAFVASLAKILRKAPPNGLIIDVRGNPGGSITAAERLLTLLSPAAVENEGLQFLNTEQTARLADNYYKAGGAQAFDDRLNEARTTGSEYISSLPLAPPQDGMPAQAYQGPVVLILDALCYSATEIFAAGVQDNRLATIMGTSSQTGGGGGNVWSYELIRKIYGRGRGYEKLPEEASFEVAIRRTTRVRDRAGVALEDMGIVVPAPNITPLTSTDVLQDNDDLLARAIQLLDAQPKYALSGKRSRDGALTLAAEGVDRVDVYVDGKPLTSVTNPDGAKVPLQQDGQGPGTVLLLGFAAGAPPGPVVSFRWDAPARG